MAQDRFYHDLPPNYGRQVAAKKEQAKVAQDSPTRAKGSKDNEKQENLSGSNKAAFGDYRQPEKNEKNVAKLSIDSMNVPTRVIPDIGPISPPLVSQKGGPLIPVADPDVLISGISIDSQATITSSILGDVTKPMVGQPSLVGLSQLTFDKSNGLNVSETDQTSIKTSETENYIKLSIDNFYNVRGASKSSKKLQKQGQTLVEDTRLMLEKIQTSPSKKSQTNSWRTLDLELTLPFPILLEQVQIMLNSGENGKLQSFSTYFKILTISSSQGSFVLKSSFSELFSMETKGSQFVELNACGIVGGPGQEKVRITVLCMEIPMQRDKYIIEQIGQSLVSVGERQQAEQSYSEDPGDELDQEVAAIFAQKDSSPTRQDKMRTGSENQIDEDLQAAVKKGIMEEEEDDMRILDSLPTSFLPVGYQKKDSDKDQNKIRTEGAQSSKGNRNSHENIETTPLDLHTNRTSNQSIYRMYLDHFVKEVVISGFNCNSIPAITNLTYFMNQSFLLKRHKKVSDAMEVDFMIGMLLISTKRSVQTAEVFRRIQNYTLNEAQKNLRTGIENTKIYIRCAIMELLISESMCIETQINEKMHALNRMVRFSELSQQDSSEEGAPSRLAFQPQILVQDDAFSIMLRILPKLLSFCVVCLSHRREIVQLSALKTIKFVLETQGCSLDHGMVFVLKGMLQTFPKVKNPQTQQAAVQEGDQKTEQKPSFIEEGFASKNLNGDILDVQQDLPQQSSFDKQSPEKQKESQGQKTFSMFNQRNSFDLGLLFDKKQKQNSVAGQNLQEKFLGNQKTQGFNQNRNISLKNLKEPSSGFQNALTSVYQHVLDTFISVLSSISSHILHAIFYEVIEPILLALNPEQPNEIASQVVVFTVKIAEKIITICQGDLIMSKNLLDMLITNFTTTHKVLDQTGQQQVQALKTLWASVRQKVFPNYSTKGSRMLLNWTLCKFTMLADSWDKKEKINEKTDKETQQNNFQGSRPRAKYVPPTIVELNDQETGILSQLCDIVAIIAACKQKQAEEEANQLIKLPVEKIGKCGTAAAELYLTIPPLLFWMEYSIDRVERLTVFAQLYQTIKDVLVIMPRPSLNSKQPQYEVDLNLVSVMMPTLERTSEYLEGNSPSLPMLKFLEIVLTDIASYFRIGRTNGQSNHQQALCVPEELKQFFVQLLSNYSQHISYSLYEEIFPIFDKLMALSGDLIDESVLKKAIISLVDKYTLKTKQHKMSLTVFMKSLMDVQLKVPGSPVNLMDTFEKQARNVDGDLSGSFMAHGPRNTYFEVMTDFCYFHNIDIQRQKNQGSHTSSGQSGKTSSNNPTHLLPQLDFRGPSDLHDLFVDKLQFFIDSLSLLNESHINIFTNLITHPNFRSVLLQLISHGETQIRLKSHEILEILTAYFVHYCPSKTTYEFEQSGENTKSKPLNQQSPNPSENFMDAEFISHERLYISQIVIKVARRSLEQQEDCYLQFNALISLDFLFQKLLPVPTFANEQVKKTKNVGQPSSEDGLDELTLDIEALSLNEQNLQHVSGQMSPTMSPEKQTCLFSAPELDVMDQRYLRMRMKLVLSLWPYIQQALNSPWSNIRSVCYGLICSIFKIDVKDYPVTHSNRGEAVQEPPNVDLSHTTSLGLSDIISQNAQQIPTSIKIKQIILPMLYGLLSSKESESKAGGLNILGSFCGLSYDFTSVNIQKYRPFFQRNSSFVTLAIWRLVYQLQDDWDITIKEASVVLVQLCAPRSAICLFSQMKKQREQQKIDYMFCNMPRVSLVYADDQESMESDDIIRERPNNLVTSRHAKKAYALFSSDKDRDFILESIKEEDEQEAQDKAQEQQNEDQYEYFLTGRRKLFTPVSEPSVSCTHIDQEHQQIDALLQEYEPVYQAALEAYKPMTRKRQLEIELDIRGKNQKPEPEVKLPVNFFVDRYSDDQIQEIISIFRNDFQPPKNLWIEKQQNSALVQGNSRNGMNSGGPGGIAQNQSARNSPDFYQEIYIEAIEQFNQQQLKLQMDQQAQLQQQVSSGSSLSVSQQSTPAPSPDGSESPQTALNEEANMTQPAQNNTDESDSPEDSPERLVSNDAAERKKLGEGQKPESQDRLEVVEQPRQLVEPKNNLVSAETQTQTLDAQSDQQKKLSAQKSQTDSSIGSDYDMVSYPAAKPKAAPKKGSSKSKKQKKNPLNIDNIDFGNIAIESVDTKKKEKEKIQKQADQKILKDKKEIQKRPPRTTKQSEIQNDRKLVNNFFASPVDNQKTFDEGSDGLLSKDLLRYGSPEDENQDQHGYEPKEDNEAQVISKNSKEAYNRTQPANDQSKKQKQLALTDNDYFTQDDKQFEQLKLNTMKNQPLQHRQGQSETMKVSTRNTNSVSSPDFSLVPRSFQKDSNRPNTFRRHKATNSNGSGGAGQGIEASGGGSNGGEQNFISRKTTQTYLSSLSRGYIQNIDNMKLIKSCLSGTVGSKKRGRKTSKNLKVFNTKNSDQIRDNNFSAEDQTKNINTSNLNTSGQINKTKKILNKSFENLQSANRLQIKVNQPHVMSAQESVVNSGSSHYTQNSQKNSKVFSQSPKTKKCTTSQHYRKPSSLRGSKKTIPKKQQQKQSSADSNLRNQSAIANKILINQSNAAASSSQNLCDLNSFIKTIEKDLSEKFQQRQDIGSNQMSTPKSLVKQVEEQLRLKGIDMVNSKKIAAQIASAALKNQNPADLQQLVKQLERENKINESKNKNSLPKLKLLTLNKKLQDQGGSHKNLTPVNCSLGSQNSQRASGVTSTISPFKDGSGIATLSFLQPKMIKTHRDREKSNSKDRQNSDSYSRGRSSGTYTFSQPTHRSMIMTERSQRVSGLPKPPKKITANYETQRVNKKNQSSSKTNKRSSRYNSAKGQKIMSPENGKENVRQKKSISKVNNIENVNLIGTLKRNGNSSIPKGQKPDKSSLKKERNSQGPRHKLSIQGVHSTQSGSKPPSTNSASLSLLNKKTTPIGATQGLSQMHPQTGQRATLLELLQQNVQSQQNPQTTRAKKSNEAPNYYSPIQITGRFMDSSQLMPNKEDQVPREIVTKNNNAQKKQNRKPPMLQPTQYY